jgi:ATP-dependent exoDNAse (exonuclease V) alpha subunit
MLPALADRLHAPSLERVHRFTAPWERHASLQLRAGEPAAIDTYQAAGRIHDCGDDTASLAAILTHYTTLTDAGRRVLILARTRRDVDTLNTLARTHAIDTGQVHGPVLLDGPVEWRAGDRLRATRNDRRIDVGGDYLRNGDEFTVLAAHPDGLHVQSLDRNTTAVLPADYVTTHARYGWAATIDSAQGATVDDTLLLARPGIDREHLYVGLTRGRQSNHLYLTPGGAADTDHHPRPEPATPARDILSRALTTSDLQAAAHTQLPDATRIPQPALPPPVRQPTRRPTATRQQPQRAPRPHGLGIEPNPYLSQVTRSLERDHDRDHGRGRDCGFNGVSGLIR